MADIKVLVADDQRLVREGISSLLDLQDGLLVVGTAINGEDAVQKAVDMSPDVILMDIRMPEMDGIQAVEKLTEMEFPSKIIMLTTFDDESYILKSMKAGALGYLMKDIPAEDLAAAVKQAHRGVFQMAPSAMTALLSSGKSAFMESSEIIGENQLNAIGNLTSREGDVFTEIGKGLNNSEIAEVLLLSEGTVKNYVSNILSVLGLRDRVQIALLSQKWISRMNQD